MHLFAWFFLFLFFISFILLVLAKYLLMMLLTLLGSAMLREASIWTIVLIMGAALAAPEIPAAYYLRASTYIWDYAPYGMFLLLFPSIPQRHQSFLLLAALFSFLSWSQSIPLSVGFKKRFLPVFVVGQYSSDPYIFFV
jgi:hypothetical protein